MLHIDENEWRYTGRAGMQFTEKGYNRMLSHGKDGLVIVSTSRSIIAPRDEEGNLLYADPQSLIEEYLQYMDGRTDLFVEPIGNRTVPEYIKDCLKNRVETNPTATDEFLMERNRVCDKELKAFLLSDESPYTFTPSWGGFTGDTGESACMEPSFIIYNSQNPVKKKTASWEDLKAMALALCAEYKQDSVYVQAPGEPPVYLDRDGNQTGYSPSLEFTHYKDENGNDLDTEGAYYSSVGRKHHFDKNGNKQASDKFSAEMVFESQKPAIPYPFNEMYVRNVHGSVTQVNERRLYSRGERRVQSLMQD